MTASIHHPHPPHPREQVRKVRKLSWTIEEFFVSHVKFEHWTYQKNFLILYVVSVIVTNLA